jgi:phosphatidylglycerophosphatase A
MKPATEIAGVSPEAPAKKPRLAYVLATALGTGYMKPGPGTWGSAFGLIVAVVSQPLTWFLLLGPNLRVRIGNNGELAIGTGGMILLLVPTIAVWFLLAYCGVTSSRRVAEFAGIKDPQYVVIDEVSGVHLAIILGLAPASPLTLLHSQDAVVFALFSGMSILNWKFLLSAFLLFRIFDITKPFPCRRLEKLPGGWGIMADDWMAGVYAAICLRLALHFHWL